tara:strand:+ start:58 stop:732 length:675 start_codon:yes stop_codon:yes gene_type:complete
MLVSFLKAGWRDICFAIPFPVTACDDINHLLDQYPDLVLTLYVDHIDQLKALSKVHSPVNISIEIDAGQHRSGVDWKSERQCHDLIQTTHASHHHFSGLTSHFGFLYSCQTKDEIIQSSSQAMMKILQLKEHLESSFSKTVSVAIKKANNTKFGLGASIWTTNKDHQKECIEKIASGTIGINTMVRSNFDTPFGGWKKSGLGVELGIDGPLSFTRFKAIQNKKS